MNTQNITSLALQLKAIGFDNMEYPLLKRICLMPDNFVLIEKFKGASFPVSFHFYFEKQKSDDLYRLIYYDAMLQREDSFTNLIIEGINVEQLNEAMLDVDWRSVFDFSKQKIIRLNDESSFETEQAVHQIIRSLHQLETTETGKSVSHSLKQKHWSENSNLEFMGPFSNGRTKSFISQRFYFSEQQSLISTDEAYRFLLNRSLEKELQAKKKQPVNDKLADEEYPSASDGSGLLKKRRIGTGKKNKKSQS